MIIYPPPPLPWVGVTRICDQPAKAKLYPQTCGGSVPAPWLLTMHTGTPTDGVGCSGSPETVGDDFPSGTALPLYPPPPFVTVVDINSVWGGTTNMGWVYIASDGNLYVQWNLATQVQKNFAIGLGVVSAGVASAGGYTGISRWNPHAFLNLNYRVAKCFTLGALG
jgi:hypothetical protein